MLKTLYLGMPGSGKTTTLIRLLEEELTHTESKKIAFVSFTKKAISEAQSRAFNKLGISKKDMPFFKTLHALAFAALGLTRSDVINDEHLKTLGAKLGLDLLDKDSPFQPLALYNLARVKGLNFFKIWEKTYTIHTQTFEELQHIIQVYKQFKRKESVLDFTDMIILYNKNGIPLPVKVAFVDEAQDLSTIQWKMLDKAFANVERLILAGDDDQCIYSWSGADKKRFLNFEGEKIILNTSYRCPQIISELANSISSEIKHRYKKTLYGLSEQGAVKDFSGVLENQALLKNGENWLILVRNRSHLWDIKKELIFSGASFTIDGKNYTPYKHFSAIRDFKVLVSEKSITGIQARNVADCAGITKAYFEDEEKYYYEDIFNTKEICADFRNILVAIYANRLVYYANALENGQDLENPKIHLSTIHGAKGSECDNVILSCDQSVLTHKAMQKHSDNEHRVFYVGVTRAKKNLYLLQVTKKRHYLMPKIRG